MYKSRSQIPCVGDCIGHQSSNWIATDIRDEYLFRPCKRRKHLRAQCCAIPGAVTCGEHFAETRSGERRPFDACVADVDQKLHCAGRKLTSPDMKRCS